MLLRLEPRLLARLLLGLKTGLLLGLSTRLLLGLPPGLFARLLLSLPPCLLLRLLPRLLLGLSPCLLLCLNARLLLSLLARLSSYLLLDLSTRLLLGLPPGLLLDLSARLLLGLASYLLPRLLLGLLTRLPACLLLGLSARLLLSLSSGLLLRLRACLVLSLAPCLLSCLLLGLVACLLPRLLLGLVAGLLACLLLSLLPGLLLGLVAVLLLRLSPVVTAATRAGVSAAAAAGTRVTTAAAAPAPAGATTAWATAARSWLLSEGKGGTHAENAHEGTNRQKPQRTLHTLSFAAPPRQRNQGEVSLKSTAGPPARLTGFRGIDSPCTKQFSLPKRQQWLEHDKEMQIQWPASPALSILLLKRTGGTPVPDGKSANAGGAQVMADTSPEIPLQELLERVQEDDRSALEELLRITEASLEEIVCRKLRHFPGLRAQLQGEDILQNATLRLLRALKAVRPASPRQFFGLAAKQVRRELLDQARRLRHAPQSGALAPGGADEHTDLDEWAAFHEQVQKLPTEEREVVGLHFYHGWTQAEVAALFKVTTRTIQRRWQTALRTLQRRLQGS